MRGKIGFMGAALALAGVSAEDLQRHIETTPMPRVVHRVRHAGGTVNAGRNALKRDQRAHLATLHGAPGGWKKALRQMQAEHREKQRWERVA